MSPMLTKGKNANIKGMGGGTAEGTQVYMPECAWGQSYLCQVCNMLLALLTELGPLGKTLLSHVCSLPCCCSNLQPDAQACPTSGLGCCGLEFGAQASHSAGWLLATNNVQQCRGIL